MLKQDRLRQSRIQEIRTARKYGGKTNPGSGNTWIWKADVVTDRELIECKTTIRSTYPLKSAVLSKIRNQAYIEDKIPVLTVEFSEDGIKCVILDENDYLEMRRLLGWEK